MEKNNSNSALQSSEESNVEKQDASQGNDTSANETLQQEQVIDAVNERHHQADIDEHTSQHEADSGSGSSTAGPEPGEGENDEPDTSGEAG
jgi:hypothetical protein